jgi:hypothetical protein
VDYVYVISPVAADPEFATKRSVLAAVAHSVGVEPLFPLDRDPGVALERAAEDIRKAGFVIADLTYERPSCYFELGLAEATGVDVGIIAKAGTPIHQVGYASQVSFYRGIDDYRRIVQQLLDDKFATDSSAVAQAQLNRRLTSR